MEKKEKTKYQKKKKNGDDRILAGQWQAGPVGSASTTTAERSFHRCTSLTQHYPTTRRLRNALDLPTLGGQAPGFRARSRNTHFKYPSCGGGIQEKLKGFLDTDVHLPIQYPNF